MVYVYRYVSICVYGPVILPIDTKCIISDHISICARVVYTRGTKDALAKMILGMDLRMHTYHKDPVYSMIFYNISYTCIELNILNVWSYYIYVHICTYIDLYVDLLLMSFTSPRDPVAWSWQLASAGRMTAEIRKREKANWPRLLEAKSRSPHFNLRDSL